MSDRRRAAPERSRSETPAPPTLVKHGVDGPYKGKYLVTKGQALGDLILTYTAAGTMLKGSGILVKTNELPIDQGFYFYNAGGPGGGVVLERGSAEFKPFPIDSNISNVVSSVEGIAANALYVKTTAPLEAGSQIGFRVRNLGLKVHALPRMPRLRILRRLLPITPSEGLPPLPCCRWCG